MDIVYASSRVTAAEVRENIPDPPSYSAIRALLRVLVEKGHLRHKQDGPRYIYEAVVPLNKARRSALQRMVSTFFDDSPESMVETLLDLKGNGLTEEQFDRMAQAIEAARREGK